MENDVIEMFVTGPITSVEKGSINSKPSNPVIAFTVGEKYKAIVKGDAAKSIWSFLKEGGTKNRTQVTDSGTIEKKVEVEFKSTLRDFKEGKIFVENLSDVKFKYTYELV